MTNVVILQHMGEPGARKWMVARLHGVVAMLEDAQDADQVRYSRYHLEAVTRDFDTFLEAFHNISVEPK